MKKMTLMMVAILVILAISGCHNQDNVISMTDYDLQAYEVNNYADASMEIVDGSISNKGLTVALNYDGEDEGTTGTWFTIFYDDNNEWKEQPDIVEGDFAWAMIAYVVERNQTSEMQIGWAWLYGELPTGRYLIVKQFMNRRGPGDYDQYYLACEFIL